MSITWMDSTLHKAHVQYQRQQMRPDHASGRLPCSEVRGCKQVGPALRDVSAAVMASWFTRLRPNFWKAYVETLSKMVG